MALTARCSKSIGYPYPHPSSSLQTQGGGENEMLPLTTRGGVVTRLCHHGDVLLPAWIELDFCWEAGSAGS